MPLTTNLFSPSCLKKAYPLFPKEKEHIDLSRSTAQKLFKREDDRFVAIVGPCSIHNVDSALAYAEKLKILSNKVQSSLFIVMRVYVEKPRTSHSWKGFIYDPFLDSTNEIEEGILQTRKLLINLAELGLPTATEFLSPLSSHYYDDLITWGFIGARTSASQVHREIASSFPFPIGFKNSIDGNIELAVHSLISASHPHTFLGVNEEGALSIVHSEGNPYAHIVLRGSETNENFSFEDQDITLSFQKKFGIQAPILIDCSHGNSRKNPMKQPLVLKEVLSSNGDPKDLLGFMLESHLEYGLQSISSKTPVAPNISITDSCLDWHATEDLLLWAHEEILEKRSSTPPSLECLST